MNWLTWMARPIVWVWNILVSCLTYVWNVVKLSWKGTKESMRPGYWLLGGIGSAAGLFLFFIFLFIAVQAEVFWPIIIGYAFILFGMIWSYAEIASLMKHLEQNGRISARDGYFTGYFRLYLFNPRYWSNFIRYFFIANCIGLSNHYFFCNYYSVWRRTIWSSFLKHW